MIHYVKRKELHVEKYDDCIASSIQSRIYAFSWYLDIVADHWDVLVLNDYEAVMPLPWRKKYFLKYITQPFFCQQLGIFSTESISVDLQEKMIQHIPKKFMKVTLNFNSENFLTSNMTVKTNYLLGIHNTFEENFKKFNNNRKRDFKKAGESLLTFEENIEINEFLDFYLLNDPFYSKYPSMKIVLQNILNLNPSVIQCFGVKSKEILIACVLILNDGTRMTYLAPVSNDLGKEKGAPTFLIAEIIREYNNTYMLDFEGSMIDGVARFYGSFGAKEERYFSFSKGLIGGFFY